MQKLLISIAIVASLGLSACSSVGESLDSVESVSLFKWVPDALDKVPLVYRPTILQGNVVTQEQVNQLKPGMSRRQVRFVLGSPTLQDVFHENRWDYPYTSGVGSTPDEIRQLSVYFEGDSLTRVSGHLHPQPESEREPPTKPTIVSVPDHDPEPTSIWGHMVDAATFDLDLDLDWDAEETEATE